MKFSFSSVNFFYLFSVSGSGWGFHFWFRYHIYILYIEDTQQILLAFPNVFKLFLLLLKFLAASENSKLWSTEESSWLGRRMRAPISPISPKQTVYPSRRQRVCRSGWARTMVGVSVDNTYIQRIVIS